MRVVCGKPGAVRHAAALVRALAATSGAAALRRGLPVYGGLFALVGLLFGGNGLQAATVVGGVGDSPLARALLWGGWLVIAAPIVEALWRCPGGFWLRSLPVPRSWHLLVLLGLTIVAEAPWVALWTAGGGVWPGIGALGGALMGHALWLARPSGGLGLGVLAVAAVGLMLVPIGWLALGTWPILDEPSNGLDPEGADMLAALLRERAEAGGAALIATNDAGFAARLGGVHHRLIGGRLTPL